MILYLQIDCDCSCVLNWWVGGMKDSFGNLSCILFELLADRESKNGVRIKEYSKESLLLGGRLFKL